MAASPGRQHFVDANHQKIVAVVQMITHLKQAGAKQAEIFLSAAPASLSKAQ